MRSRELGVSPPVGPCEVSTSVDCVTRAVLNTYYRALQIPPSSLTINQIATQSVHTPVPALLSSERRRRLQLMFFECHLLEVTLCRLLSGR